MARGDRRYRIRGLGKNLSHEVLKVNLLVSRGERFYVDTLDLYSARQRAAFTQAARRKSSRLKTRKSSSGISAGCF